MIVRGGGGARGVPVSFIVFLWAARRIPFVWRESNKTKGVFFFPAFFLFFADQESRPELLNHIEKALCEGGAGGVKAPLRSVRGPSPGPRFYPTDSEDWRKTSLMLRWL